MKLSAREILRRLGGGESIDSLCQAAAITRPEFEPWWKAECASRVPSMTEARRLAVRQAVHIDRDRWGIPHIFAETDADLFFAFGYAMAQDRLWQLDFLRRKGSGRLAEVLGPGGENLEALARTSGFQNILELDILARTVGLRRIAEKEWHTLSAEVRAVLEAFSAGINALMDETREKPPVEFDLLDYRPQPWSPIDSLTIETEFRWYLTGRFPVIVIPEVAKRTLGDGPLYRAILHREFDHESILPPGSYPKGRAGTEPVGTSACDPRGAEGSNNWVVSAKKSKSGQPMVASDPHIAFDAVSCWYEVHLSGGSFNVAGMAYVGMPAVMFGRNAKVAWGCTNNILSQRDLYQEKTDPGHPNCFQFDGKWELAGELDEIIPVKDSEPHQLKVRSSRNGPIVTDILPPAARKDAPVSLKWLGAYHGGWLTALLAMDRARNAAEFREAIRPWHVPAFSIVYADTAGRIGYQAAGRIPIRNVWERGYRPGWDPKHSWDGLISFEGMPHWEDPERGWLATANNRVAPDDFPYPLSGCWNEGHRFARIRQMFESQDKLDRDGFGKMHQDDLNLRAVGALPHLLQVLSSSPHARVQDAMGYLRDWDGRMTPEMVGPTLFEVFFVHWTRRVAAARFPAATAGLVAGGLSGLSAELLADDKVGWFQVGLREPAIHDAMFETIEWLKEKIGRDMSLWNWGALHTIPLRHVLSGRGDLGTLLDHGGLPVRGCSITVCNTGSGPAYEAKMGAGYRLIAELDAPGLWASDGQSQSGHPGSPHYADQLGDWLAGRYHWIPLEASQAPQSRQVISPR